MSPGQRPVFTTPDAFAPADAPADAIDDDSEAASHERQTADPQHCYVCKRHFTTIHSFYDQLCLECGERNFAKRNELADLTGRTALLTGGRVKITINNSLVKGTQLAPSVRDGRAQMSAVLHPYLSSGDPRMGLPHLPAGADYVGCGAVWATASKPKREPPIGVAGLRAVCAAVRIPVIAIGGVTAARVGACLEAGAHGVAVIAAVCAADDPRAAAAALARAIGGARRPAP